MKRRASGPGPGRSAVRLRSTRPSVPPRNNEIFATMPDTQGKMTDTFQAESRGALLEGDRYIVFLAIVLLGYALMGKGFAYLGLPPLYMGEIALLSGIVVFLRTGAVTGALATLPAVLLV